MRTLFMTAILLLAGCTQVGVGDKKKTDSTPEPKPQPGEVKVEKEVTFKASFDEVLKVFQDNKDEIKKIDNTKIVWRREDKVRMELTTPQGLVTYFILQERKGLDEEKKEAFFQSTIIETDGFITKQDTLTVLTEKDGKAVIKMNIHVVCPEIPAIFLRMEVKRQAQSVIRKIKKLLNED